MEYDRTGGVRDFLLAQEFEHLLRDRQHASQITVISFTLTRRDLLR
jgi:hypothetical protein